MASLPICHLAILFYLVTWRVTFDSECTNGSDSDVDDGLSFVYDTCRSGRCRCDIGYQRFPFICMKSELLARTSSIYSDRNHSNTCDDDDDYFNDHNYYYYVVVVVVDDNDDDDDDYDDENYYY